MTRLVSKPALGLAAVLLAAQLGFGGTLEISIRHCFAGEPLALESLRYTNDLGEQLLFTRLSYLLSGFALEQEHGQWVELPNSYAWIDAGQRRASFRLDGVAAESYRCLRFHIGLDPVANAADPATFGPGHALNPNLNGLHWSWQGGYVFLALEGRFATGAAESQGFSYHLARDLNQTLIQIPARIDLSDQTRLQFDFDLASLLNRPRQLSFKRDGSSTHSRDGDPIAAKLVANLPGAFTVASAGLAGPQPEGRKVSAVSPLYLPGKFTPYHFKLNRSFPLPNLPRDNPLMEERIALGEKLFHETALSRNGALSCGSCHEPSAAFADSRRYSVGVGGQLGSRNAMPLFNLAWKTSFFWDGRAPSLRAQALMPIQDHAEMDETLPNIVKKLTTLTNGTPAYPALFERAFGSPEVTAEKIGLALEQFLLTLTSYDSKFDRAARDEETLSALEQRGFDLFMTEYEPRTGQFGADCFHCHGGPLFSNHQFHNNGLPLTKGDGGRMIVSRLESDRGKFSTPSLRNVELTAPYMHDGRFSTLEEVVEHYNTGITNSPTLDPNLGKHPTGGLHLSASDKQALVAFLKTLTDDQYRGKSSGRFARQPSVASADAP